MSKVALITGITGQDGSYLADLLLHKGYEVHGIIRRSSSVNTDRLDGIYSDPHEEGARLKLHYGDLTDSTSLHRLLEAANPSEIYNLGAQSHVRVSFDIPEYTVDTVGLGTLRLLEAVRTVGCQAKFYQAGSSEMFGGLFDAVILNEKSRFYPRSPYGCAKVFAHNISVNYRESYNMHISNGILFNHESPRRGITFVTRKITRYVSNLINSAPVGKLYLGNLNAMRDWGYTPEYVKAMWLMLQQDSPDDYVIATGITSSVRDFLTAAFQCAGIEDWESYVEIDPRYYRPAEVDILIGDSSKAQAALGWKPTVGMRKLAEIMVNADAGGEDVAEVRKLWTC